MAAPATHRSGVALCLLALVGGLGALTGCHSTAEPEGTRVVGEAPPKPTPAGTDVRKFGGEVGSGASTALKAILAAPSDYRGKNVVVEGAVRKACSRKGCWMELATAHDESAPGCRVTFKDYGFFVPTNSAGTHARLQGTVKLKTLSKAHVDHYESEGATFPKKKPDGTAVEVRLVATGVELSGWPG